MDDFGNDAVMKETVRLWRAWRTVHEMVADRVRPPCIFLLPIHLPWPYLLRTVERRARAVAFENGL